MLTPKKTIDSTKLLTNLLDYIKANQAEAFLWANPEQGLKEFRTICNNASGRVVKDLPSLVVVADEMETDFSADILQGAWRVRLEVSAESDLAEELVIELKNYADAIEKLLIDIGVI